MSLPTRITLPPETSKYALVEEVLCSNEHYRFDNQYQSKPKHLVLRRALAQQAKQHGLGTNLMHQMLDAMCMLMENLDHADLSIIHHCFQLMLTESIQKTCYTTTRLPTASRWLEQLMPLCQCGAAESLSCAPQRIPHHSTDTDKHCILLLDCPSICISRAILLDRWKKLTHSSQLASEWSAQCILLRSAHELEARSFEAALHALPSSVNTLILQDSLPQELVSFAQLKQILCLDSIGVHQFDTLARQLQVLPIPNLYALLQALKSAPEILDASMVKECTIRLALLCDNEAKRAKSPFERSQHAFLSLSSAAHQHMAPSQKLSLFIPALTEHQFQLAHQTLQTSLHLSYSLYHDSFMSSNTRHYRFIPSLDYFLLIAYNDLVTRKDESNSLLSKSHQLSHSPEERRRLARKVQIMEKLAESLQHVIIVRMQDTGLRLDEALSRLTVLRREYQKITNWNDTCIDQNLFLHFSSCSSNSHLASIDHCDYITSISAVKSLLERLFELFSMQVHEKFTIFSQ